MECMRNDKMTMEFNKLTKSGQSDGHAAGSDRCVRNIFATKGGVSSARAWICRRLEFASHRSGRDRMQVGQFEARNGEERIIKR